MPLPQSGARLVYAFGEYQLDSAELVLRRGPEEVPLSPTLLAILATLVESSGRIVTKEELIERVWPDRFVEEGNLTRNISYLRKALGTDAQDPRYIQTIPRRGYRFIADVRVVEGSSATPQVRMPSLETVDPPAPPPNRLTRRVLLGAAGSLATLAVGWRIYGSASEATAGAPLVESLVVLPLEDLSSDSQGELFADGMTDALISDLGKIGALKVISRTTANRFKATAKTLPEVADELGVEAVVEGSTLLNGDRIRITVRLVEAATDHQLWTDSYERELADLLDLQREVARSIAQRIEIAIAPGERQRLEAARNPVDPEAQQAYLRGLFLKDGSNESIRNAISYFEHALKIEPRFAPAYAGIADAYLLLGSFQGPSVDLWPTASEYAAKALKIDDTLAEAYVVKAGVTLCYDFDQQAAERLYAHALELSPNSPIALRRLAYCLSSQGRFEEAIIPAKRAIELDPLTTANLLMLGQVLYLAGRQDDAQVPLMGMFELNSNAVRAHRHLGFVYLEKGMFEAAIESFSQAYRRTGAAAIAGELAFAYAVSGQRPEAVRRAAGLKNSEKYPGHADFSLAMVYAGLGEADAALKWLEKACKAKDYRLVLANVDPIWKKLRPDPRFGSLIAELGLRPVSLSRVSAS